MVTDSHCVITPAEGEGGSVSGTVSLYNWGQSWITWNQEADEQTLNFGVNES